VKGVRWKGKVARGFIAGRTKGILKTAQLAHRPAGDGAQTDDRGSTHDC
jgi:hypothetical protein